MRGAYGEAARKEPLQLTLDGEKSEIELPVGARRLTGGEIRRALEEAAEALPELLLGETPPQHVDHDLVFPEKKSKIVV